MQSLIYPVESPFGDSTGQVFVNLRKMMDFLKQKIEALLTLIPRELSAGNIVELGEFGSFRLRIQSEGAETPEGVTAHNIKKILPRFVPGKEFSRVLDTTEFVKADTRD